MAESTQDPMNFVRNLWGNMGFPIPGMVTPTLDTQDLGKRITDLKAVESWLRMNLSMLQMTIQNLEMQSATLSAVQTISGLAAQGVVPTENGEAPTIGDALHQAALFPWNMMQQMSEQIQKSAAEEAAAPTASEEAAKKPAQKKGAPKKGA